MKKSGSGLFSLQRGHCQQYCNDHLVEESSTPQPEGLTLLEYFEKGVTIKASMLEGRIKRMKSRSPTPREDPVGTPAKDHATWQGMIAFVPLGTPSPDFCGLVFCARLCVRAVAFLSGGILGLCRTWSEGMADLLDPPESFSERNVLLSPPRRIRSVSPARRQQDHGGNGSLMFVGPFGVWSVNPPPWAAFWSVPASAAGGTYGLRDLSVVRPLSPAGPPVFPPELITARVQLAHSCETVRVYRFPCDFSVRVVYHSHRINADVGLFPLVP